MRRRRVSTAILAGLVAIVLALVALDRAYPPDLGRAGQVSVQVLADDGDLLRAFATPGGYWRLPLAPGAVEPLYRRMLLAYEDRRFTWHPGVDPLAVLRAAGQWLWHGEIVSGASTLTMQVARLLEPIPHDLGGKLRQMLRALQLEWRLSKDEILGLYLRLAPYGGNLEGLRAASLAYLVKEPAHLTPAEAALLVALPQSPEALRPDRYPERARAARDKVLARLVEQGVLSPATATEARDQPIPRLRRSLPFIAPHLARRLRRAEPDRAEIHSTLDLGLQLRLEALARQALSRLDSHANLAVLVVRNRDRAVRAYLGSADFFAAARGGQLDLAQAVRSPGSTLKPAVYGLAFDELLIHPETLILDAPTRFGDYRPDNFLNAYHGEVSIREALQRSLNVPAVAVLERLGPERVATRLGEAGIELVWPDDQRPGLPLVLGGVGTTLTDLVNLYAAIADDGRVRALRYRTGSAVSEGRRLLSVAAVWYLHDILAGIAPPAGMTARSGIAFKTGTSYGFRDAWALGFDRAHTVGVWVGRPDGTPSPDRHGRNTAAPVLLRVFELLPAAPLGSEPPPPGVLTADNGELPERLRRFERPALDRGELGPRLTFPAGDSAVELQPGQTALPLVAEGGRRPLHWLVNGRPLAATGRQAFWPVTGAGGVRITVLDSAGRSASAEVWLTTAEPTP